MSADPATLQIGRVTLLGTKFRVVRSEGGIELIGHCITGETFVNGGLIARAWESDLKAHMRDRDLVAVSWERRGEFDGFYRIRDVELETWQPYSNFAFRLDLGYALEGRYSADDLRFESRVQGAVKTNDHTITTAAPFLMPPPHSSYEPTHASTTTRDVAYHGLQTLYRTIDIDSDPPVHPRWDTTATDYYVGAARVARRDPLYPQQDPVAGLSIKASDPEDIGLDNGICRAAMVAGELLVEFWDGTAWRPYTIETMVGGTSFTDWSKVAIRNNQPERCVLRYRGGDNGRYGLYVSLRRGERGATLTLDADVSSDLGVREKGQTAMTETSPRLVYTSADANGHKLGFVTTRTYAATAASAYMHKTTTTRFDVGIFNELSGAGAGNLAADLQAQYFAAVRETVEAWPA